VGLSLFPGTLNVRLSQPVVISADFVLERPTCVEYEDIKLQRCIAGGLPALILRTSTQEQGNSHPLDVLEIMAGSKLRETLNLNDGDPIVVEANLTPLGNVMSSCACGCGKQTAGGSFVPGHDQKLRTRTEERVGGVVALAKLVDSVEQLARGQLSNADFEAHARRLFTVS